MAAASRGLPPPLPPLNTANPHWKFRPPPTITQNWRRMHDQKWSRGQQQSGWGGGRYGGRGGECEGMRSGAGGGCAAARCGRAWPASSGATPAVAMLRRSVEIWTPATSEARRPRRECAPPRVYREPRVRSHLRRPRRSTQCAAPETAASPK